jgi:hypothetical protein
LRVLLWSQEELSRTILGLILKNYKIKEQLYNNSIDDYKNLFFIIPVVKNTILLPNKLYQ